MTEIRAGELDKGDRYRTIHTRREGTCLGQNPIIGVWVRWSDRKYEPVHNGSGAVNVTRHEMDNLHPDVKVLRMDD